MQQHPCCSTCRGNCVFVAYATAVGKASCPCLTSATPSAHPWPRPCTGICTARCPGSWALTGLPPLPAHRRKSVRRVHRGRMRTFPVRGPACCKPDAGIGDGGAACAGAQPGGVQRLARVGKKELPSNVAATSSKRLRMGRCCGHACSHFPHFRHSPALPCPESAVLL